VIEVNKIYCEIPTVLNLYAGIGGNRKYWTGVNVTAVEIDPEIAAIYQNHYPEDNVVVGDAHQYLLDHFRRFDFIWSSPPCPSHSRLRTLQKDVIYVEMSLYQEILLLKHWYEGKWLVENVIPYYEPLIAPTTVLHRHNLWCNFYVPFREFEQLETCKKLDERAYLQDKLGFNLDQYSGVDKRKLLRNCVVPEMGKHIFDAAYVGQRMPKEPYLAQAGLFQ